MPGDISKPTRSKPIFLGVDIEQIYVVASINPQMLICNMYLLQVAIVDNIDEVIPIENIGYLMSPGFQTSLALRRTNVSKSPVCMNKVCFYMKTLKGVGKIMARLCAHLLGTLSCNAW